MTTLTPEIREILRRMAIAAVEAGELVVFGPWFAVPGAALPGKRVASL